MSSSDCGGKGFGSALVGGEGVDTGSGEGGGVGAVCSAEVLKIISFMSSFASAQKHGVYTHKAHNSLSQLGNLSLWIISSSILFTFSPIS